MRSALCSLFVTLFVTVGLAQDREFIAALEGTQAERPAKITTSARIAPESEPGIPLVIHGRAFGPDGRTPLTDAIVFAYHTDREGRYNRQGSPPHSWRLRGWAKTDAAGRFEFQTIRPGSYPNTRNPAHVHVTVFTPDGGRFHAGGLQFADDPVLPAQEASESARLGEFGSVRPVRREGDVQHVDFAIRLDPRQRF
jgi:protocatechuate 3,4-dioxygenase beta subunit